MHTLETRPTRRTGPQHAPPSVHAVLRSHGRCLDTQTLTTMENAFAGHADRLQTPPSGASSSTLSVAQSDGALEREAHAVADRAMQGSAVRRSTIAPDFSGVRIHADDRAASSAQAVNARAYTVGRDVVFGVGQYSPGTESGRRLIAHELTHVLQHTGGGAGNLERNVLSRDDAHVVEATMRLGETPRTGFQFVPDDVLSVRVGSVSAQGGLASHGMSQLSVIVGPNLTVRHLARQILPLWLVATPFTPPGAAAPLPLAVVTEESLAQALLVFNQYYLPLPSMANWRPGLRFPLPADFDLVTGAVTLHPLLINSLASAFDPAWAPLLEQSAAAGPTVSANALQAEAAAFLNAQMTASGRGIHLAARALTNVSTALPFLREAFRQLGAAGFEVVLALMDTLVNTDMALLAAQRDGAAIVRELDTVLTAGPAALPAAQATSLNRAELMIATVWRNPAAAPPMDARTRAEKTVTIDTVKLEGSTHDPATEVSVANGIFTQCNIRLSHGVNATATPQQTTSWLGANARLDDVRSCSSVTPESRALLTSATAAFALSAQLRVFYPPAIAVAAAGYAYPPFCPVAAGTIVMSNNADSTDLAHEIGHILMNSASHPDDTVMNPTGPPSSVRLTDRQCRAAYRNV